MSRVPIVVPVRFAGGGLSMQTTSSRLGADGIFVRCLVAPREGAQMKLELTIPGAARPVAVSGVITERVTSGGGGKDAGFFVRFDALSADASRSLDAVLRSRGDAGIPQPPPPPQAEPLHTDVEPPGSRRAYARVLSRLQVGWASPREFLVAYSENISRGGIFIATPNPPPLREVVELLLELPDGQAPAKTQAEVVQRTSAEEARQTGRIAGAGLQFVGGDDEFRLRLDACIENLLTAE